MQFRETKTPPVAAAKASISAATAYRFEHDHRPPSTRQKIRGRRRPDPLADIFDSDVVPMLEAALGLRCVAIFEEMQRRHPELASGVRRTLERRIRAWRALHGAEQEVIFRQVHEPGRMGLSDFTDMADLAVTIAGVLLDHRRTVHHDDGGLPGQSAQYPRALQARSGNRGLCSDKSCLELGRQPGREMMISSSLPNLVRTRRQGLNVNLAPDTFPDRHYRFLPSFAQNTSCLEATAILQPLRRGSASAVQASLRTGLRRISQAAAFRNSRPRSCAAGV